MNRPTGLRERGEQRTAYFEALGKFVYAFAKAEAITHLSFRTFARLDASLAMTLKGGMRLSDLMSVIRDAMAINGFSEEDQREIDYLFAQLSEISTFRNRILHRGAEMLPDGTLESTNHATMKAIELLEVVKFTLNDIRAATSDLNRIALRVAMFMSKPGEDDDMDQDFSEFLQSAWRYKPLKPETPNRAQSAKPRGAGRRRRSAAS